MQARFAELSDRDVRVLVPLSHKLAETLPTWGQRVAPYAEMGTHTLAELVRVGSSGEPP